MAKSVVESENKVIETMKQQITPHATLYFTILHLYAYSYKFKAFSYFFKEDNFIFFTKMKICFNKSNVSSNHANHGNTVLSVYRLFTVV